MQSNSTPQLTKIAVLDNLIEAQLISSILDQRDIVHRLRSYHDTAYDGLFQVQKGWGELYASRENKQEILAVLEEMRNSEFDQDDNLL